MRGSASSEATALRREGPFRVRGCFSEERRPEGRRVQGDNQQTLPPQTPVMKTSLGDPSLLSYLG